jgi:hypothetical protein
MPEMFEALYGVKEENLVGTLMDAVEKVLGGKL